MNLPVFVNFRIRLVEHQDREWTTSKKKSFQDDKRRSFILLLTVSAITISNGGDDIGVFTPLFARYNTPSEVTTLVIIFMAMTLVWCIITYYFVNHPLIATRIQRFGNIITPFVLIGLGLYILVDALFI
jgi:cadmium resistance protein CadD (predicted permease)